MGSCPLDFDHEPLIHARTARRMFSRQSCYFGISNVDRTGKARQCWNLRPQSVLLVRAVWTMENLDTCQSVLMQVRGQRVLYSETASRVLKQRKSQANTIRCLLHQPLAQCMHDISLNASKISSHHEKANSSHTYDLYRAQPDYTYSPSIITVAQCRVIWIH
jgi:hypothetical protein